MNQIQNIKISVNIQDNLPNLGADFAVIGQVLLNIINNVLDSIYNKVNVWVRTRTSSHHSDKVSLTIKDDNKGISKDNFIKMYKSFFISILPKVDRDSQ